jgi:chromosome segregation ATPase
VQDIIGRIRRDQETLDSLYYPRLEEYHALEEQSQGVLDEQKSALVETVHEIEVLGARLDYEINALRGKVVEVKDGVGEFERHVLNLEARVEELEEELKPREGWVHWVLRLGVGVGRSPSVGERDEHVNSEVK